MQHSALNHTERLLQWQMIQDGGADIVVGTRSAVFAPLEGIGLIVIDEEQEHTYRSESAPRYSAHEVARWRAAHNGALLLLASATPSTESFYEAQAGRCQLVRLTQRYAGQPLPAVQIVDMRAELAAGNPREISLALEDALRENLAAHKQAILLLNPPGLPDHGPVRGTAGRCSSAPSAASPWSTTKTGRADGCCATTAAPRSRPGPQFAPPAAGKLQYRGFGTQKAEEELAALFPEARILRMDQDTTAAKDAHEKLLASFARHEYDIMVGTQMVAKGLDFEDVTLVGVLGIDSLLFAQGFRAYETVFSLVTQVVGRSGPGVLAGAGHHPDHRPRQPRHQSGGRSGLRRLFCPGDRITASLDSTRPSAVCASSASRAKRRGRWLRPPRALPPCWGRRPPNTPTSPCGCWAPRRAAS